MFFEIDRASGLPVKKIAMANIEKSIERVLEV
jgi:hypothetical protein